ncbi:MAG TPA: zf-TFIIB domain-containing protein [Flavisolibacter sp.]|nr:zf-TFIIB domain-containing protein [Flavisolibacter sp.]
MKCPNCNETLVMADRHGIEIDYCPNCRGVWLDRGELDKIVERSASYSARPDSEYYEDDRKRYPPQTGQYKDPHYGHDPHYKHKKKKGFLSDFFDFD